MREKTQLAIGRGEVWFDRFLPGTRTGEGERYLGNTPSFRIQREVNRLERATSYRGKRIARPGAVVSESHEMNFTTDNLDIENIALWFGSTPTEGVTYSAARFENHVVMPGRSYQLGRAANPAGLHNLDYIVVRRNGTVVPIQGNYEVDRERGRVAIMKGSSIPSGTLVEIEFQTRASNAEFMRGEPRSVYGALRFLSFNEGHHDRPRHDMYFPLVQITPRGQTDLKSDEWQQWAFDAVAMNLSPALSQVYITRSPTSVGLVPDEQAIVDELGNLTTFPFWEDRLDVVTNTDWPRAVTGV